MVAKIAMLMLTLNYYGSDPNRIVEMANILNQQKETNLFLAIAYAESTFRPNAVSTANACCWMGIKTKANGESKYGNPPCDKLNDDSWLCLKSAQHRIYEYKSSKCGKARFLECYNRGWAGAMIKTANYTANVRRLQKSFRRILRKEPTKRLRCKLPSDDQVYLLGVWGNVHGLNLTEDRARRNARAAGLECEE